MDRLRPRTSTTRPITCLGFCTALAVLVGPAGSDAFAQRRSSAPESITVRVVYKGWGGVDGDCDSPDWGWDSLTWRIRPREDVPGRFNFFETPPFRVGRAFATDSAWLFFRGREIAPGGRGQDFIQRPEWDSLVVTSSWTPTFTTIGVYDAAAWLRVRLVDPWPEPPRKPIDTATLVGSVVDDSTGRALRWANVIILGTKLKAYTDTLGYFALAGVAAGKARLDACAFCYTSAHADVHVPGDSLTIRLRRNPRCRFVR